ncbi:MAG: MbnP family protein [Dolichospermum sp.]
MKRQLLLTSATIAGIILAGIFGGVTKTVAQTTNTQEVTINFQGRVGKQPYQGLQFTLGVPVNLNHADSVTAPSPLNLTSLWWNWLFGYKFARLDWKTKTHDSQVKHGEKSEKSQGFSIHLGSTFCQAIEGIQKPSTCSNLNASKVIFTKFDVNKNVVIAIFNDNLL